MADGQSMKHRSKCLKKCLIFLYLQRRLSNILMTSLQRQQHTGMAKPLPFPLGKSLACASVNPVFSDNKLPKRLLRAFSNIHEQVLALEDGGHCIASNSRVQVVKKSLSRRIIVLHEQWKLPLRHHNALAKCYRLRPAHTIAQTDSDSTGRSTWRVASATFSHANDVHSRSTCRTRSWARRQISFALA